MRHIVFITGSYYPYYSAVSNCIGNIANEFEDKYKVTILCEKNMIDQGDDDLFRKQRVVRVTTKMHYKRIVIEDNYKKAHGIHKFYWKIRLLNAKIVRFLRTAISLSACDQQVIDAYMKGLTRIAEPIDCIIPSCNPFESVVAALLYKEKHPDTQIIPYLFDLFAASVNINRGSFLLRRHWNANMTYEKKMFEEAKSVFFVSNWKKHIHQYFSKYQYKFHEVEHPLLVIKNKEQAILVEEKMYDEKTHIVYTGVVDYVVRNPNKTLDVLSNLDSKKICFDFYSYGSAENLIEKAAVENEAIIAHGKVDSNMAECARSRANLLLSIGNSNTTQMPSKLIEYIASGKPIIHFMQNDKDPSVKLLEQYPLAKIVDLTKKVDYIEIDKFIHDNTTSFVEFETIKRIFSSANPEFIANEISSIFEGGRERYNLIFAGSLIKDYVDARYVLKLFNCNVLKSCKIYFFSAGNGINDVKNTSLNNIILKGWVNKEQLYEAYNAADAFISIAEHTGERISSKIFEYMANRKRIIHIYYSDDDVNLKYLHKYPKALCLKATDDKLHFNQMMIILFLKIMSEDTKPFLFADELIRCTPQYIADEINSSIQL